MALVYKERFITLKNWFNDVHVTNLIVSALQIQIVNTVVEESLEKATGPDFSR